MDGKICGFASDTWRTWRPETSLCASEATTQASQVATPRETMADKVVHENTLWKRLNR